MFIAFLCSCGGKEEPTAKDTQQSEVPKELFSNISAPPMAVQAAKSLAAGAKVTVKGKVMGSHHPFVENRASFVLGDPAVLTSCDMRPGDNCKTPWDACCDDKKVIQSATLNIQVLDGQGSVLKTGLKGQNGLKELSEVVIEGVVDASSTPEATVINAEKIQVVQ
jgi:hypothetical protein